MKKTYFDLTKDEIHDYQLEFKNTPGGKNLYENNKILITLLLSIFVLVVIFIIVEQIMLDLVLPMKNITLFQNFIEGFGSIILFATIAYNIYINMSFVSW